MIAAAKESGEEVESVHLTGEELDQHRLGMEVEKPGAMVSSMA